MVNVTG